MTRNLKALGLALLAVLAMSAVAASGASAELHDLFSEDKNTIITGTQDDRDVNNNLVTSTGIQTFTRGATKIECHEVHFEGTSVGETDTGTGWETDTIELTAEYTTPSCVGPSNSEVHVDFTTDGCGYHFTITANTTAAPKLTCAKGEKKVRLTPTVFGASICTISVPAQTPGGHVTLHNKATNGWQPGTGSITAEATVTGITSSRVGSALCGPAHSATATYTGNSVLKGYEDDGDTTHPLTHDTQIDIEVTHT